MQKTVEQKWQVGRPLPTLGKSPLTQSHSPPFHRLRLHSPSNQLKSSQMDRLNNILHASKQSRQSPYHSPINTQPLSPRYPQPASPFRYSTGGYSQSLQTRHISSHAALSTNYTSGVDTKLGHMFKLNPYHFVNLTQLTQFLSKCQWNCLKNAFQSINHTTPSPPIIPYNQQNPSHNTDNKISLLRDVQQHDSQIMLIQKVTVQQRMAANHIKGWLQYQVLMKLSQSFKILQQDIGNYGSGLDRSIGEVNGCWREHQVSLSDHLDQQHGEQSLVYTVGTIEKRELTVSTTSKFPLSSQQVYPLSNRQSVLDTYYCQPAITTTNKSSILVIGQNRPFNMQKLDNILNSPRKKWINNQRPLQTRLNHYQHVLALQQPNKQVDFITNNQPVDGQGSMLIQAQAEISRLSGYDGSQIRTNSGVKSSGNYGARLLLQSKVDQLTYIDQRQEMGIGSKRRQGKGLGGQNSKMVRPSVYYNSQQGNQIRQNQQYNQQDYQSYHVYQQNNQNYQQINQNYQQINQNYQQSNQSYQQNNNINHKNYQNVHQNHQMQYQRGQNTNYQQINLRPKSPTRFIQNQQTDIRFNVPQLSPRINIITTSPKNQGNMTQRIPVMHTQRQISSERHIIPNNYLQSTVKSTKNIPNMQQQQQNKYFPASKQQQGHQIIHHKSQQRFPTHLSPHSKQTIHMTQPPANYNNYASISPFQLNDHTHLHSRQNHHQTNPTSYMPTNNNSYMPTNNPSYMIRPAQSPQNIRTQSQYQLFDANRNMRMTNQKTNKPQGNIQQYTHLNNQINPRVKNLYFTDNNSQQYGFNNIFKPQQPSYQRQKHIQTQQTTQRPVSLNQRPVSIARPMSPKPSAPLGLRQQIPFNRAQPSIQRQHIFQHNPGTHRPHSMASKLTVGVRSPR